MAPASTNDELDLRGWDVLAVGRRQAWLFVTFGAPSSEREERTLWIDTTFRVSHAGDELVGTPVAGTSVSYLEPLVAAFVEQVALRPDDLELRFDNGFTLRIANEPDADDSNAWWLSPPGTD